MLLEFLGINLEFARLLLQNGANVVFADLALRPEAEELVKQYSEKALFKKTDVTSWSDLNDMFTTAISRFGGVDIACPGAGVFEPPWSAFWYPPGSAQSKDDPLSGRYKLLDINLTHPIRVTQLAMSHFLSASPPSSPSNPKSIVHIASIAGETVGIGYPLYHVSKHGVQALVRSLDSLDESHGIRVTCVMPGVVKTPLWTDHPEKLKLVKQEGEDADQWVTPEEVAQVMLACVKDERIGESIRGASSSGTNGTAADGNGGGGIVIKGGSCLEVLAGYVRDVPLLNNVGPYASGEPGATVQGKETLLDEIYGVLKPGWGSY